MLNPVALFLLCPLLLMACLPADQQAPPPAPVAPTPPAAPALNERGPDSCGARGLTHLLGRPAGNLRTVRLKGPSRIIPPGGIFDQEEYDAARINAWIDGQGLITRMECG